MVEKILRTLSSMKSSAVPYLDSYCNFCESKGILKIKLYHLIANTKVERDICKNADCSLALEHVTGYLVGFPQMHF